MHPTFIDSTHTYVPYCSRCLEYTLNKTRISALTELTLKALLVIVGTTEFIVQTQTLLRGKLIAMDSKSDNRHRPEPSWANHRGGVQQYKNSLVADTARN